jgi:alpha-tubulin suppressor-like RCC1 family protein
MLGHGKSQGSLVPAPVSGDLRFAVISAGLLFHTCGVTVEGVAYCWGNNAYGQCGSGRYANAPARVAEPPRQ